MRILFVTNSRMNGYGGVQSVIAALAGELDARGCVCRIACPSDLAFESAAERDLWCIDYLGGGCAPLVGLKWIREQARDFGPDLIHSHNLHIPLSPVIAPVVEDAAFELNVPHVTTVHDVGDHVALHSILRSLRCSHVVTQSEFNAALLAGIGIEAEVLPVGIQFGRFANDVVPEQRTVAYPGRPEPSKGAVEMLYALEYVALQTGRLRVLLSECGAGSEFRDRIDRARTDCTHLDCEILGSGRPVEEIYRRSLVTIVAPKHPEGFGLVPMEALASGRPVIASPTGGMCDWLPGLPGVAVVPRLDTAALLDVLKTILNDWDAWSGRAKAAAQVLSATHDSGAVADRHISFYARAAARRE